MHPVTPAVFLIAETGIQYASVEKYLDAIEAAHGESVVHGHRLREQWTIRDHGSNGEELAEIAGRVCYRSFAPGLNPNVTQVRADTSAYLQRIIEEHHGSVFEHPSASFLLLNVSRVLTHELVRHRVGVAISQESLRYVRLTDLGFWWPGVFRNDPNEARRLAVQEEGNRLLLAMEDFQKRLAELYGLDEPGAKFAEKKAVTSAMRRFAPLGLATSILWTANLRTLRHVLTQRTALAAEEEIRLVFDQVGNIAASRWPAVFQDFVRDPSGQWKPAHEKI